MINIAQIGYGYWGPNITRNLINSKKFNLSIVCDLSRSRLKKLKSIYPQIRVTTDIKKIIKDKNIKAVIISTPVKTHFKLIKILLDNNKHLLVEKPLVTSKKEFDLVKSLCEKNKLLVMTGYTFLFNPSVLKIKQIIDRKVLGKIRYVYSQRLNLGRVRSDINAFWNFAPHDLSILNFLFNIEKISNVKYSGRDFIQKNIDDVCFVNFVINESVLYNMHLSWLDPYKTRKLFIVGSKKMLIYDDVINNKIKIINKSIDIKASSKKHMDYDNYQFNNFIYKHGNEKIVKINKAEPLSKELDHFYESINDNKKCLTGISFSKKVLSQMLLINKL